MQQQDHDAPFTMAPAQHHHAFRPFYSYSIPFDHRYRVFSCSCGAQKESIITDPPGYRKRKFGDPLLFGNKAWA